MANDESVEWVRAAEAARMLGISRERVRQLIEDDALEGKREPKRVCLVSVASIKSRLGEPIVTESSHPLTGA